jgi:hypothetical protein
MKNILIIVCVVLFASCGSANKMTKEQRTALVSQTVHEMISSKDYTITVHGFSNRVMSSSQISSSGYILQIKGESLSTHLPFSGTAHTAVLGGSDYGMTFDNVKITNYSVTHPKTDLTIIKFNVMKDGEPYTFTIEVYDNAEAKISVGSRKFEGMTYSGELNVWEKIYNQ